MRNLLYLLLTVFFSISVNAGNPDKPKAKKTAAPVEEITVYDGKFYKKDGQPNNIWCKQRNRVCWIKRDCTGEATATCPVPEAKVISLYTDDGIERMVVRDVIYLGQVEDPNIGEIVNAYEIIYLEN
jgi:hypothetical protein